MEQDYAQPSAQPNCLCQRSNSSRVTQDFDAPRYAARLAWQPAPPKFAFGGPPITQPFCARSDGIRSFAMLMQC